MNNIDTLLDKIKADLRAFIEEEVRREVATQLGTGKNDVARSNPSSQTSSPTENVLFDLEELSNKNQIENINFDNNSMHDLEDIASGYSTQRSDSAMNSSATNAAIAPGGSSNSDLDSLISMSDNPIAPVDTSVDTEIPTASMPDQLGMNLNQSSPVLETYAPSSGMQNAFNFLKRVLKS